VAVYNPSGSGGVHVDEVLTNMSIAFPNDMSLAADALFPALPVTKQSNKYNIFGRESWLPEADLRAPGTEANEIPGIALSSDTYYAQEHSLQVPVTDEERENSDGDLQPEADGTRLVTEKIMIGRERYFMTLATTAANYATGMTSQGNTTPAAPGANFLQFDTGTTNPAFDPVAVLRFGMLQIHNKIFRDPNVAVIPYRVMWTMLNNAGLIERIKYSQTGILNRELVGTLLGIENMTVVVPGLGFQASSTSGVGYLWDNDIILAYVPPNPGKRVPAYGYEFVWGYNGRPQVIDRWREEKRKSDLIRCSRRYDGKMTSLDTNGKQIAGFLFLDAVV
jgi:hypothetical protein